jgi:hypothetical protein
MGTIILMPIILMGAYHCKRVLVNVTLIENRVVKTNLVEMIHGEGRLKISVYFIFSPSDPSQVYGTNRVEVLMHRIIPYIV